MSTQNALQQESSLYLRQHATNPVAWHAWNEETLQKARAEKKPILLSIGYSACHWCHVMAHESFEDAETADIMNTHFINIKVDKEERPDLDKLYQCSLQLLTRRTGGWPLTLFLHYEDLSPFFGGTYFPDTPRYGMPSFKEILEQISRYFNEHQSEISSQREPFRQALSEILAPTKKIEAVTITDAPLSIARHQLGGSYDPRFSGFGLAPKFPHPQNLERLLLHWHASLSTKEDPGAYNMPLETLRTFARSGLYDQLGGGFFRYSVDEEWKIPHFEKMLYDNGLLLSVYAMAYSITKDVVFKNVIVHTAQWLKREMRNTQGGFYASIDADSQGKEGLFYVWDEKELSDLLSPEEFELVRGYYALQGTPNFEEKWHLHAPIDFGDYCASHGLDVETSSALLDSAKEKLFSGRKKRIKPHCDEKIITSWNSLVAKGLLQAGAAISDPEITAMGIDAIEFIYKNLWVDEKLFSVFDGKKAKFPGYLDDYAFLLDTLFFALQVSWRNDWLLWSIQLSDQLVSSFEDKANGGFYFTSDDAEKLLARAKPLMDEAMSSGNALAALALQRFGFLLGNTRYLDAAYRATEYAFPAISETPFAYNSFLNAVEEYLNPPTFLIFRGKMDRMLLEKEKVSEHFSPHQFVFCIPEDAFVGHNAARFLPDIQSLVSKKPQGDFVSYCCVGTECKI